MGFLSGRRRPDPLGELWRVRVPGVQAHCVWSDATTHSVYVGDGWGVAHAALRLHRFDSRSGVETASTRTRSQGVGALATADGTLWVATDKRLLALDPTDLAVRRQWDKGLVSYTQQLLAVRSRLVMANWLKPTIGVFDPASGSTRRVQVGPQPVTAAAGGEVVVLSAVDGGSATLDLDRGRLQGRRETPPATAAVFCGQWWCVAGGRRHTDRQGDRPIPTRKPAAELFPLLRPGDRVDLVARCFGLYADPARQRLWAVTGQDDQVLQVVDAARGQALDTYAYGAEPTIAHVDPELGLALVLGEAHGEPPSSWLIALRLPD